MRLSNFMVLQADKATQRRFIPTPSNQEPTVPSRDALVLFLMLFRWLHRLSLTQRCHHE